MNQNVKRSIEFQFGVDLGPAENSIESLESQLESLKSKFKVAEIGSAEFDKLGKEIDSTTRELKKLEEQFNQTEQDLKSQEANIKLLGGAINILGGAVETTVGTLGLLGLDEEVVGEFEKAALGAIAFADGTKRIFEGYKELQEGVQLANDLIKKQGLATKILTGIQAAYNAVMNANPIFIIITVLAAVTVGIYALSKALADDTEELKANNEERAKQKKVMADNAQFMLDYAKSAGKSSEEIREAEKNRTQSRLDEARADFEAAKGDKDRREKAAADIKKYKQQLILEDTAYQTKIRDENKKTVEENEKKNEQAAKDKVKNAEVANELFLDQLRKFNDEELSLKAKTDEEKLKLDFDRSIREINELDLTEKRKAQLRLEAEQNYNIKLTQLKDKQAEEQKAKDDALQAQLDQNALNQANTDALKFSAQLDEIYNLQLTDQQRSLNAVQDKYFQLEQYYKDDAEALILIEKQKQAEIDKILEEADNKEKAARKEKIQARLGEVSAVAGAVGGLFGSLAEAQDVATKEGFEANKKYKIAEVVTSAIQGGLQAIAGASQYGPAGPFVAAAQLATIAIASKKAISNIQSTQFGDSTVPSSPNIASTNTSFTGALPGTGVPNITPPTGGGNTPGTPNPGRTEPIRAYVIASDVSNGIEARNSIGRRRRFGTN
jgi:hypothetical protein